MLDAKRMAPIAIYEILKMHSDENHILTQEDIRRLLEKEYSIVLERKAIGRYLHDLEEYDENLVVTSKGSYLYQRTFNDFEIRLLIDAVLSSKYISKKHSERLINNLCTLSNKYFKTTHKSIYTLDDWDKSVNEELFLNMEIISEAIARNLQISFCYNRYGIDKKLHPVCENPFIVNPYQLILTNNNYYLVGNIEGETGLKNFKLEKITRAKIYEVKRKDARCVEGTSTRITEYVKSHPYMRDGAPSDVRIKIKPYALDEAIDFFGKEIRINHTQDEVFVDARANLDGVYEWCMRNGEIAEVVYPQELRNKIRRSLCQMEKTYLTNDEDIYDQAVESARTTRHFRLETIDAERKIRHKLLKELRIVSLDCTGISDISFLKNSPLLVKLRLANDTYKSFEALYDLTALRHLSIVSTNLDSLDFLDRLPRITALTLLYNEELKDYTKIYSLKRLSRLCVDFEGWRAIDKSRLPEGCEIRVVSYDDGQNVPLNYATTG